MFSTEPVLHLVCGKVASGKSTLTKKLGEAPRSVVITEDEWLAALYPAEMLTLSDYVRCAARLQAIMGPHVTSLLRAGISVVLDFHANTIGRRAWMRDIAQAAEVAHELHYLDAPDAVCKARLQARNASGEHPFSVTEEQFDQLTRHFVAPTPEEGLEIVIHRWE